LHRTPLHSFHEKYGARFVEFAGWEMPILYRSIIEEHQQVRTVGGMFDVSHMGRLRITGRDARTFLERLLTRQVTDMAEGQVRYALICNEQGGTLDDVLVYRDDLDWLLVVNASNRKKIVGHMSELASDYQVEIDDQTLTSAMIALQGPKVVDALAENLPEAASLKRYRFTKIELLGAEVLISRTGYTGEDGIEAIFPIKLIDGAFELLGDSEDGLAEQFPPAGLGARDTLRIEAGMPLYGHELAEDIDPLTAGLKFAVSLDKGSYERVPKFVGQDAIASIADKSPTRQLVGLKITGKRTPRQGAAVLHEGVEVGVVTSGCMSPTLGQPIAMALVKGDHAEAEMFGVDLGRKQVEAARCPLPFYKPGQ